MKSIITMSLLALSMNAFAGVVRMVATGECSSIAPKSTSADVQKAELTKCAESRAHSALSQKCEGRGTGWLLESNIAKREFNTELTDAGREMSVSTMAVGRCEF